ncbi:MAG: diphthine--ammonia ligase [Planctomycetota bacterium]
MVSLVMMTTGLPQATDLFCSWSGGKDICLAVHRSYDIGGRLRAGLTMLDETGERSRSHGLPRSLLEAQAEAMGIDLVFRSATWGDYTDAFVDGLEELNARGLTTGVFGDIDIESHRQWVVDACERAGVTPMHPIWQEDRRALVDEGIARGIRSRIVVVNTNHLPESFLGRELDAETVEAIVAAGADACGENGEYHSLVTDAPLMTHPLAVDVQNTIRIEGYAFHQLAFAADRSV